MKGLFKALAVTLFAFCLLGNIYAGGGQQKATTVAPIGVVGQDGPLVPYEKTLEIQVPLAISANLFFIEGEDVENNFVTNFYTEKLNIRYKGKWIVDSSQADEKLNAAIASNDLPDIFSASSEVLGRVIKAGQVQPLWDVYDKYATPRLKEIMSYQDGRGFLAGRSGGKVYALPVSNDYANNIAELWIRKDWLEKLNLAVPKTLDDLLAVARAFRDQDPGGNGKGNTIAIALDKGWGQDRSGINALSNPLNAYSAIWIPDGSGGLKYGSVQPEMKDALQFMQGLYKEGLLDKEFAVKDSAKVTEDIAAGKVGIYPGVFWSSLWPLNLSLDNNPKADWVCCPISLNKDGKKITQNKIFSYYSVAVRTGFPNPEALVKSMNLWAEMFHGQYADYFDGLLSTPKYKPIADIWHGYAMPVFFSHPLKNQFLSDNFIEAWNAQNIDLCTTGEARNRYDLVSAGGTQGWAHKNFLMQGYPVLKQYDGYVYDEFVGPPTDTMVLRTANLKTLEDEAFFSIIMGEPISKFDEFVNNWKSQGGDAITSEVSAWYRSVQ